MNRRRIVVAVAALALLGGAAVFAFYPRSAPVDSTAVAPESNILERAYSPKFGPDNAPVTIVEFFDPACEACRAMHPVVKKILSDHPDDVRLVLRYTPFHDGSEEVVRILEAARMQGIYATVLDAILAAQPQWARHDAPNIGIAIKAAADAGLNVEEARKFMMMPDITAILLQDKADVKTAGVRKTPTFFVNGKPLPSFGPEHLRGTVLREIEAAGRARKPRS